MQAFVYEIDAGFHGIQLFIRVHILRRTGFAGPSF